MSLKGLVDYGSSGSESEDEEQSSGQQHAPPTVKAKHQTDNDGGFFDEGDDDAVQDDDDDGEIEGSGGSTLALPTARNTRKQRSVDAEDDEVIEDIAKPKDWEKKLAEKARRKLEKKAAKRAEKEKRRAERRGGDEGRAMNSKLPEPKKKGPVKIAAFGGLSKAAIEKKEEEEEEKASSIPAPTPGKSSLALFSMLPAPKSSGRTAPTEKSATIMLPPSLRAKNSTTTSAIGGSSSGTVASKKPTSVGKPSLVSGYGSSDEDDDATDFFGLASTATSSAAAATGPSMDILSARAGVPMIASYGLSEEAGPSRPEGGGSYGYAMADDDEEEASSAGAAGTSKGSMKTISNEQAQELIFKHDYAPWGFERQQFTDADIVDVSVDKAIGPNVHETLLKNLNRQNLARASLPALPKGVNEKDRNAKRKHQITYLANLAVAREEALQQKWAEGKAAKRMARQKYGF